MSTFHRSELEHDTVLGEDATAHFLTREEAWFSFDEAAQGSVGKSGEAFIAAWDAGRFGEDPDRPALIRVAVRRPVGR